MTCESPERLRVVSAQTASTKYDALTPRATHETLVLGRLRACERRGALPVMAFALCELPGHVFWWLAGVFALAGVLGAWAGDREARRAIYAGQSPTLARLRARVATIRHIALTLTGAQRAELGEQVRHAADELRDLELPAGYHPRRSTRPLTDQERPLGARDDTQKGA